MKKTLAYGLVLLSLAGCVLILGQLEQPEPAVIAHGTVLVTALPARGLPSAPLAGLEVDASGHLKTGQPLRRAFDRLLGRSDLASADDVARAQAVIRQQLREPASREAEQLLNDYLNYRQAAHTRALEHPSMMLPADKQMAALVMLQNQQSLRSQTLSAEGNQALYGDDDAMARFQLAKNQLAKMNGLSVEQKNEQLSQLYAQLPLSAQIRLGSIEQISITP